jgi:hypothetical protein
MLERISDCLEIAARRRVWLGFAGFFVSKSVICQTATDKESFVGQLKAFP